MVKIDLALFRNAKITNNYFMKGVIYYGSTRLCIYYGKMHK